MSPASSVNNVNLGPVLITWRTFGAGWTTEEGVSIALPGHDFVPIKVDEFGMMSIGKFDIGVDTEKVLIKFALMENTPFNRELFNPLAQSLPAANQITVGRAPFSEVSSFHGALNLHPRALLAANLSRDFDFHLAFLEVKGDFVQDVKSLQNLPIEGSIIADTSKTAGNYLFTWGGVTS